MNAPVNLRRRYRFGLFEADSSSGQLLRKGVRVRLQDQPFRLLTVLLEHAGEVVSRENLRQTLWPADTYVAFDGSLNAALTRLRAALGDVADNPVLIETIPKRGYRFIAPVTIEDEASETEIASTAKADAGTPAAFLSEEPLPREVSGRPFSRLLVYGLGLFVTLAAVSGLYFVRSRAKPATTSGANSPQVPARKSVAVLGFRNASGRSEDDWLTTALSEMVTTELSVGDKLRLVPGEEVAHLRLTEPWPQTITLGRESAARIGTALNSGVLVFGSYTSVGNGEQGQLRLDVTLQDARTGEVLGQIAQTGGRNDLFQVTSDVGAALRARLGVPEIRDAEQAQVLASLPLNREAARLYALGIARLREFDALAAKDLLAEAAKADPKFSLAHLMLARAWGDLGYQQQRKQETKLALDLSIDLPRTERLLVEGDYYESLADHEKAASAYRALHELFPDSVEYGLQLTSAENLAGHRGQALETIAQLRRLPPPASLDPSIDISEAKIVPRGAASMTLLKDAASKASAQGRKLVYARARLEECVQVTYGEHPEQASVPCEDAYNIYLAAGNRLMAADAARLMADQQSGAGHLTEGIASYQRALKILEGLGDYLKTATVLNNMAIAYTTEGDLARAEKLYRQAKSDFEQVGDKSRAAIALVNIADIFYLRGMLPSAAKTYQQVIDLEASLESGDPGYALYRLADLELARGNVRDAHRLAKQALDLAQSRSFDTHGAMTELAEVLEAEADLAGARQQQQAAMQIRRAMGRNLEAAENQVALAEISLEEGHPEQAESLLREPILEFEKEKADPDTAFAYTLLSRSLLLEAKIPEARTAIQQAASRARSTTDPAIVLPIAIQQARIDRAEAKPSDPKSPLLLAARRKLRVSIAHAKRLGYYTVECEARLALAELEATVNPSLGHALMKELASDAAAKGFLLVSKKATL